MCLERISGSGANSVYSSDGRTEVLEPRPNTMDGSKSARIFFNTDALPERDRFPAFCEEVFRRVIGADIVQLGPMPFRGMLEIRRAGVVGTEHGGRLALDGAPRG